MELPAGIKTKGRKTLKFIGCKGKFCFTTNFSCSIIIGYEPLEPGYSNGNM